MRFSRGLSVIGLLAVGGGVANAADAPAAPAAPVPSFADILTGWGLTANGYVAASYYHSNGYPANIHQFDTQHDTFQLDEAGFSLAYQPKQGFGALVDVIAGEDARILQTAEGGSGTIDVRQAFLQYASGPLTVIAGKYVTLAGAEVINPTLNTNFSRSLIFFDAEPLTHTGVRATYAVTDTFNLIGGVNNGWNVMSTSYGSKTAEVGAAWTPNKIFSLAAQGYFGKTPFTNSAGAPSEGEKTLVDVVATYNATSALTFILNVDWDRQENAVVGPRGLLSTATWYGAAGYVNYALSDQWRVSTRAEYYNDKDGFTTGTQQHLWEGTVTVGYAPAKSFELRAEVRYDNAQDPAAFLRSISSLRSTHSDSLFEFALEGVYKFGGP